jgi:hypothetical protein
MLKQIFKENIPSSTLFALLDKICLKTEKYYLVDQNAFKKMLFLGLNEGFLQEILPSYHTSKQFYVTRKFNYNSFTNILRQICKSNSVMFHSMIKYNESSYTIDYFVYY